MQLQLRLSDTVFCVYFSFILTLSYCNKLHCYKGRVGTKERKLTRLVSCTTPPTLPLITACVIYRYQRNGNGSQTNSSKLFFSGVGTEDFACDEKHLCNSDRMTTWTNNTTFKGFRTDMYCCSTSGCNDPRGFTLPQTHIECYFGKSRQDEIKGEFRPCRSNYCFNVTTENSTEYGCDMNDQCGKGLSDGCSNIKGTHHDGQLCCCEKSQCNVQLGRKFKTLSRKDGGATSRTPVKPVVPMDPDGLTDFHREELLQKSRVAGIVSAVVLGVALVILLTVIAIKQWQKYREKYNFSYMQLTADMMTL